VRQDFLPLFQRAQPWSFEPLLPQQGVRGSEYPSLVLCDSFVDFAWVSELYVFAFAHDY
jgi:hypothetical protein